MIEFQRDLFLGQARLQNAIARHLRELAPDPAVAIAAGTFCGDTPFDDAAILTIGSGEFARRERRRSRRPLQFETGRADAHRW